MSAKVVIGSLTISEDTTLSTNGDTRLDWGEGAVFDWQIGEESFTFFITILSSSSAVYKSRLDELRSQLVNQDRDVEIFSDDSTSLRAFQVGVNCAAIEAGTMVESGDTAGRFGVTILPHLYLPDTEDTGIVGLQDVITFTVQGDGQGNYLVEARARFKRTSPTVTARDNAAAWRETWFTGPGKPDWINRTIKEYTNSPVFDFEEPDNECTVILTFYTVKQNNLDLGTLPTFVESVNYEVQREGSPVSYPLGVVGRPNAPTIMTISGTITFRLDTDISFPTDDTNPETHGVWSEVINLANRIVSKAATLADRGNASVVGATTIRYTESGSAAEFKSTFLADSQLISWDESITYDEQTLETHVPVEDGTWLHFDGAIKAIYTAVQTWNAVSLGTERKPRIPTGFRASPERTSFEPKRQRQFDPRTGSTINTYAYSLRRELWSDRPHRHAEIK